MHFLSLGYLIEGLALSLNRILDTRMFFCVSVVYASAFFDLFPILLVLR